MNKAFVLLITTLFYFTQLALAQNPLESKYDVKQYILDLKVSNTSTVMEGNVMINAQVMDAELDTFAVDLINTISAGQCYMVVDSAFINGVWNSFQHQDNCVKLPLATPLSESEMFSAQIFYHGKATPVLQSGYTGVYISNYYGKSLATTESAPDGSRTWWPCKQDLADKADSVTLYLTTNVLNKSGSNGLLRSADTIENGTRIRYKWVTRHPIDYYLVSFAIGPYDEVNVYAPLHAGQDSVLIESLLVANSPLYPFHLKVIEKTKKVLELYSELFGDYPFMDEKYGYSVYGGGLGAMEHQTMTTIGADAMDTTSVQYGPYNFWYTAHELGHQWFGDYVTCADWNDIWLNEGIASYLEYISLQHLESQHSADAWMQEAHSSTLSMPGGSIYGSMDYRLMYKKSAAMIHMLRYEINNDSLFFAVLTNYLNTYKNSVASTEDFRHIAESTTGFQFTDFFSQWVMGEGYPVFDITWTQQNDSLIVNSTQTTSTSVTNLFKTHFDLKIKSPQGDASVRLFQASNNEVYKIYFPGNVDSIQFDPLKWLIQKNSVHVGMKELAEPFVFHLYPDPAMDLITVETSRPMKLSDARLLIYDLQGRLVLQKSISQVKTIIDVRELGKGTYLTKFIGKGHCRASKFVKE